MNQVKEKPLSGGEVLLKKKGPKYFKKLAKDGWATRKARIKEWEAQQKKDKKVQP